MAAIDFPSNPNSGDQFVVGTVTWTYDGAKWTAYPGVLSVPDAPSDGKLYGRQLVASTMSWTPVASGDTDAPIDNSLYGRKNRGWIHPTHLDITDWAATLAPYALTANVPGATSTLPKMDGTATTGSEIATFARGDHVHPTDTSRAATSAIPVVTTTMPVMDGTATIGATGKWADGGHIHPTDTSRAAASALAGYLPLTGGTLTGGFAGTTAAFGGGQVNITGAAYASIALGKGASGNACQISGYTSAALTAASLRWNMAMGDVTAESGANAGSNFSISRYSDAGGFIDSPLAITRSSGFVTVTNLVNTFLRHNAHSFQFNYVNNSNLNQFACSIDGSYNVVTKSVVVGAFSSTIDTWAFNVAGSSIGAWAGPNGAQWTVAVSSDRRLKSNLAPSSKDALAALCSIPVYECDMTQPLEGAQEQHWDWALIADEVRPVVPLAVIDPIPDAGFDYAAMREYPLIPVLIRAVQQLAARVAELEAAQP